MDDLKRLTIERACENLVNEYANLLDAYEYDAFINLWAEDAILDMLGTQHAGHAGIRRWLEGREPGMICRHLVTNVTTRIIDADNAAGSCYTIAFRAQNALGHEPGVLTDPTFLVSYRNHFRRDPQRGWLFSRRDVTADLVGAEQMRGLFVALKARRA
jgi:ketosteroid isomerase-like protein